MERASPPIVSVLVTLCAAACGTNTPLMSGEGAASSSAAASGMLPFGSTGGSAAAAGAITTPGGAAAAAGMGTVTGATMTGTGATPPSAAGGTGMAAGAGASSGAGGASSGNTAGQTSTVGGAATAGSGGAAAAGAPTSVVLAPLVTSGPGAYWNTDAPLTELATGTADLVVDETVTHQRWDGFGGTFNEMGWDALSVVSSEIPTAMTLLFDAQDGANFVYGRLPIGASDYSMSWYTFAETPDDYAMDNFTIDRDREMMIPYIRAALEVKPDLRLWGSPWVIPDWMKDGRAIKTDPQTLEAHALYFSRFVEEYAAEGLTIEAVHLQNEPGYGRVSWDDSVFVNFFKTYLGPKFIERSLTTEIWCGTISNPDYAHFATDVANDPESMEFVKGFGLQWNHEGTVPLLTSAGPVMQTEHRCGNYNFATKYWDQSRYDASTAQNDHLYAEESWQLIRDWIVAGVNSYLAWNMVLDTNGVSLDGWPQNALLVVDRSAQTLITTPAYHVFRHFSQYISPGATRIDVSGSDDALAFKNPDGSVVVHVYNSADADAPTTVQLGSGLIQFGVPAHGWATARVAP